MLVAMSTSAFAAAPTTTQNEDGSWTTAGSDAAYADSMMTILAYSGDAISVDSIQYIDQTTADETGAYSFASYLPKVDPAAGVQYTVKVGGQNIDTPLAAGYIFAAATDVTVSGVVTCLSKETGATVTFTPVEGGDAIVATTELVTGAFTINVPAGNYVVTVTKAAHTKYVNNAYAVEEAITDFACTIYAGNTNGDELVGLTDITPIINNLGAKVVAETINSDTNDDNIIGLTDITPIINNLGANDTVLPVVE